MTPTPPPPALPLTRFSTVQQNYSKFIIAHAVMCLESCAMIFWIIIAHLSLMKKKTQKDYSQDVDDHIYNNLGPELISFEIWAL